MKVFLRRLLLGLGVAGILGGWGTIQYGDAQLEALFAGNGDAAWWWLGERTKTSQWLGNDDFVSGKTLFFAGALGMGLGAAVVVLAFPRGSWTTPGYDRGQSLIWD